MVRKTKDTKRPLLEFLTENFFQTLEEAENAVKLGVVYHNGRLVKRSGIIVDEAQDRVQVIGGGSIFVSRGGYKLQEAIKSFELSVEGKTCVDIGASTGGFTDCLLQYGARKVYAVDTGYGQLAWKLRSDERVRCVERMNVRYLMPEKMYDVDERERATLAVIDVSFISAIKVLPSVQNLLAGPNKSEFIILIKPQFEAGKNSVARGGVIKNPSIHFEVLKEFIYSSYRAGLDIHKLKHSPLLGQSGNLEFITYATWPKAGPKFNPMLNDWLEKIVNSAYSDHGLK